MYVQRKVQIGADECCVDIGSVHLACRSPRNPEPTCVAIEGRHAILLRKVPDQFPLIRVLREDFDAKRFAGNIRDARFYPTRNPLDRGSPSECPYVVAD